MVEQFSARLITTSQLKKVVSYSEFLRQKIYFSPMDFRGNLLKYVAVIIFTPHVTIRSIPFADNNAYEKNIFSLIKPICYAKEY